MIPPIIECVWFDIRFAYVMRLVLNQLGPVTFMTVLVVLTRPFIIKFRRALGFY